MMRAEAPDVTSTFKARKQAMSLRARVLSWADSVRMQVVIYIGPLGPARPGDGLQYVKPRPDATA